MPDTKTKQTAQSVDTFLSKTEPAVKADCQTLVRLMQKVTGAPPKMWGSAIVGFGSYHYKYASGHEGDICIAGFSPRKQNLSLYVMAGAPGQDATLKKLGKHKAGKGCLWVKKLQDIDLGVLEELIRQSVTYIKEKYPDHQ